MSDVSSLTHLPSIPLHAHGLPRRWPSSLVSVMSTAMLALIRHVSICWHMGLLGCIKHGLLILYRLSRVPLPPRMTLRLLLLYDRVIFHLWKHTTWSCCEWCNRNTRLTIHISSNRKQWWFQTGSWCWRWTVRWRASWAGPTWTFFWLWPSATQLWFPQWRPRDRGWERATALTLLEPRGLGALTHNTKTALMSKQ